MHRLTCLDGLRGVLAMYVMVSHVLPFAAIPASLAGPAWLFSHGGAGVDMFFILSGLVILRSLRAFEGRPGGFLLARASRIYPVYLLAFAAALALRPFEYGLDLMPWIGPDSTTRRLVYAGWPENTGLEIGLHLVMAHGLFPDAILPHAWVRFLGTAWSLSTEWQFYVLVLLLALWRLRDGQMALAFLALAAAGTAWMLMGAEGWQFSRAFLPNKAHLFALGIASSILLARGRAGLGPYLAVLAATLVLAFVQGGANKLAVPLAWSLCLAAQAGLIAPLARLLCHPALLWLGAISYPLYIAHEGIQKTLCIVLSAFSGGDSALFTALWLPSSLLLPIIAAWGLHRWLEVPVMRWGRGVAARKVAQPLPA